MSEKHPHCHYCGFGYVPDPTDPEDPAHCGRSACARAFDTMDFPCYTSEGKEWCMYPYRHLAREYWHEARRQKGPQGLLI